MAGLPQREIQSENLCQKFHDVLKIEYMRYVLFISVLPFVIAESFSLGG